MSKFKITRSLIDCMMLSGCEDNLKIAEVSDHLRCCCHL